MNVTMHLNLEAFEFELADSQVIDELVSKKKLKVTMLDHYGRLYEGDLAEAFVAFLKQADQEITLSCKL